MQTAENAAISVLLVDDDERLLKLLQEALAISRAVRFKVRTASTLNAALQHIGEVEPDVILLDLTLPDSTDYQTFRAIYDAAPDTPIVILSGVDDEALAIRMVQEGAQDYVLKGGVQITMVGRTLRYAIERKNAKKALHAERNLLRNVINSLPEAVCVKNTYHRYIASNSAHTAWLGANSEQEVIGRTIFDFHSTSSAARITDEDDEIMQSGAPVLDRLDSHRNRWRAMSKVPLRSPRGNVIGLVTIARDVTDQKITEQRLHDSKEQLRALAASLQADREEFRKQIARELHDEIGQVLTALRIELVRMSQEPPVDRECVVEMANTMTELVNSCIGSVRHICAELRPRMLDDLGLLPALEWQAKEFQRRTNIECIFSAPSHLELDGDRSTALFRIAQEALTNVVRHAAASRVEIAVRNGSAAVELEIRDNGRGITPEEIAQRRSLGLLGMRERVECLGGTFAICGEPGGGTKVKVTLN